MRIWERVTSSIRSRLILSFMMLIVISTSVISVTLYRQSTTVITDQINNSLREKLAIVDMSIRQRFSAVDDYATGVYLNQSFIDILSAGHPTDKSQVISEMSTIERVLNGTPVTSVDGDIFTPKVYIFNRPEYLLYSYSDEVTDVSVIEQEQWYKNLPKIGSTVSAVGPSAQFGATGYAVRYARRLYGLDDTSLRFAGVLTIDVGMDTISAILNTSKPTDGSSIFIFDQNDVVVASSDQGLVGHDIGSAADYSQVIAGIAGSSGSFEPANSPGTLAVYQRIDSLGWTIVSLVPIQELERDLTGLARTIVIVVAICLLLAGAITLALSSGITQPIRQLVNSMKTVQSGQLEVSVDYRGNDEFAYLITAYNNMVHELKELIDKLYLSQMKQKESELKALQSQINPHFLYNTLDSINWMALEKDAKNISIMVTALSDFFRLSLSKGKSVISIRDEKQQVEDYLTIQCIRFQERLSFRIAFDDEILGCLIAKLTLQPLVENSILHGINQRRGPGLVEVTGKRIGPLVEIAVTDDGVGADIDELNAMLADPINTSSFGAKNVDDRIKHIFGQQYGVEYRSNDGPGITALVRFPAVTSLTTEGEATLAWPY